ncbi:TetR/AcrR family transcriptional regulator [Vreelandella zhanjiangensis]|uniref:TetR/AcrR family transcriptional regulator n=1 Tax=Vreelandella zhanjiangensis TaxID=1121960 RepID=UPI00037AAAA3|nr:TetR/AcrR family transcriptional regulator [Halomonas zhanjiangensis]
MDIKTKLISAAESLFDRHGFTATGIDRLTQAAGMSSRTLYKHAGSKHSLIAKVLSERDKRFLRRLDVSSVDALFKALEDWVRVEGCRGCLFLRAYGETGGDVPEIAEVMAAHKAGVWSKIQEIIALETNGRGNEQLAEQILILFEGATATAIYRGADAVATARHCAVRLVKQASS